MPAAHAGRTAGLEIPRQTICGTKFYPRSSTASVADFFNPTEMGQILRKISPPAVSKSLTTDS
jgi:hypothetical protein